MKLIFRRGSERHTVEYPIEKLVQVSGSMPLKLFATLPNDEVIRPVHFDERACKVVALIQVSKIGWLKSVFGTDLQCLGYNRGG